MAKPPPDADPEKFILGRGTYSNLLIARPYFDDRVFRIDPTPMPVCSMVIYNLLFISVGYGFHWALKHHTHGEAGHWIYLGVAFGITLFTCVVFTVVVYCQFAKAWRLGPWLIYDRATGRVELPREKVAFGRQEIVHLQYVTTKRLDWGGVMNNDRLSELNLVTERDGKWKRWPLLQSIFTSGAFDYILKPLLKTTDLPVLRVQDEWLGWRITETPYGRAGGNQP